MIKIQIIIDDGQSLKGITCTDLECISEPAYEGTRYLHSNPNYFTFIASNIVKDESSNLISIPDELLERIRDHDIDAEHQNALKQTFELKQKIEFLKMRVWGWEERLAAVKDEAERYHTKINEMIDKYPMVAAEIALKDGDVPLACHFAQKANEEEEENGSKED